MERVRFQVFLFVFLISTGKHVSSSSGPVCCPRCSVQSINQLNTDQIQQVKANAAIIASIEQDPLLLYDKAYQRSIVTLTDQQDAQILRNFPSVFMDGQTFNQSRLTVGILTATPNQTTEGRPNRSALTRVCEPFYGSDPLVIVHKPNGKVVELVQMPGQGLNQWILEETCQTPHSNGMNCCLAERHVLALYIDLSGINNGASANHFDFSDVVVQCCVAAL